MSENESKNKEKKQETGSNSHNKPDFNRQNSHKMKRVPSSWRKPRGKHSPMRKKEGHAPKMPNIGFRTPKDIRGLHPSGLDDVLVHNTDDLEELDPERHAVRIASTVGGRKRAAIVDVADEQGLKVLNAPVEENEETEEADESESADAEDEDAETDADDDTADADDEQDANEDEA